MILFLGFNFPTLAQEPCGFDERIREAKLSGENYIDRSKKLIKQAIASGAVNNKMQHTIPVVVHVIHLGEPIGIGTNISNAQIESAITNLNERFSNANGLGVDVEIDFCLATKDPFGNDLPNGAIVRENGFGVCAGGACYENVGITSANELEVKALSNWPNCDYYNVWVVSEINGNNGGSGVQGYAYFPGAPNGIDGTVMLYNAFGTVGNLKPNTDLNTIFTHELGHGLGLFHTFEGDCPNSVCLDANGNFDCNLTICPSLDPSLGDEVADTDAHRRSCSNCDISGMNTCYNPSRPNSNIITNYMDYSSQDCQTKFTAGQKTIMQAVMATERSCLSTSLGCLEECGSVDADFTGPLASTAGVEVDFINTSIGATNFIWEIDGVEVGTSTDLLDYVFDYQGFFKVCLIASNAQCTDFYCYDIAISGQYNGCEDFELDKCDVILNGDFSQPSGTASFSYSPSPIYEFDRVCNWFNRISSPDYCGNINQRIPSFFMYSLDSNNESIGTVREIPFVEGEEYEISFKYEVNSYSIPNTIELGALKVGLSQTREASGLVQDLLVLNPPNDFIPDDRPVVWCEQELLNQHSFSFIYDPSIHGKYLYVEPVPSTVSGGYHIVRVGDIHVYSCEPECFPDPDFTFTVNNCNEVDFVGDNFGDPGSYNWDFGYNNETGTGKNISHTFLYDGTFDVCLTIECGQEFESETICQEVIIDGCEDCGEADITDVVLCDQNGNGNYLGHIEFLIPEDVSICDTDPEAWSPEVSILVNNWNFSQAGAGQKWFIAEILVNPGSFDLDNNPAEVFYKFCLPNGDPVCYRGTISGSTCGSCNNPIVSNATCDPLQSGHMPGMYVHTGTVTFTIPSSFDECLNHTKGSDLVINNLDQVPSGSGNWVMDYSVITSDPNPSTASAILCFFQGPLEVCIPILINVPEGCEPDPDDCDYAWYDVKTVDCSRETIDDLEFDWSMSFTNAEVPNVWTEGWTLCNGQFLGTIDGGTVDGTVIITGSTLSFSITITMPKPFVQGHYDLVLYFCNSNGEIECLYFPLYLLDNCGGDQIIIKGDEVIFSPIIYPNPAADNITIDLDNYSWYSDYQLEIYDTYGRKRLIAILNQSTSTLDILTLQNGIYFTKLIKDGALVKIQRVAITK